MCNCVSKFANGKGGIYHAKQINNWQREKINRTKITECIFIHGFGQFGCRGKIVTRKHLNSDVHLIQVIVAFTYGQIHNVSNYHSELIEFTCVDVDLVIRDSNLDICKMFKPCCHGTKYNKPGKQYNDYIRKKLIVQLMRNGINVDSTPEF